MDDDPRLKVKSITLNEGDQQLVQVAARLLVALEPGQSRISGVERVAERYWGDLVEAHPGADDETLDEMTDNFTGALLLEMERCSDKDYEAAMRLRAESIRGRARVFAAIRQMLDELDPRH